MAFARLEGGRSPALYSLKVCSCLGYGHLRMISRYYGGVTPTARWNARKNVRCVPNPHAYATRVGKIRYVTG